MTPCRLIVHLHIFVSIRTLSSFLHLAILVFSCNFFFPRIVSSNCKVSYMLKRGIQKMNIKKRI